MIHSCLKNFIHNINLRQKELIISRDLFANFYYLPTLVKYKSLLQIQNLTVIQYN